MAKKSFKNPVEAFITTNTDQEQEREVVKVAPVQPDRTEPASAAAIPTGYILAPEAKTKRVQLLIQPSVHDAIKKKAAAQGISFNEYVNIVLREQI